MQMIRTTLLCKTALLPLMSRQTSRMEEPVAFPILMVTFGGSHPIQIRKHFLIPGCCFFADWYICFELSIEIAARSYLKKENKNPLYLLLYCR
jgi:hypothetical protein